MVSTFLFKGGSENQFLQFLVHFIDFSKKNRWLWLLKNIVEITENAKGRRSTDLRTFCADNLAHLRGHSAGCF